MNLFRNFLENPSDISLRIPPKNFLGFFSEICLECFQKMFKVFFRKCSRNSSRIVSYSTIRKYSIGSSKIPPGILLKIFLGSLYNFLQEFFQNILQIPFFSSITIRNFPHWNVSRKCFGKSYMDCFRISSTVFFRIPKRVSFRSLYRVFSKNLKEFASFT